MNDKRAEAQFQPSAVPVEKDEPPHRLGESRHTQGPVRNRATEFAT